MANATPGHLRGLGLVVPGVGEMPKARDRPKLAEVKAMKYVMFICQALGYDPKGLSADEHKDVAQRYAAVNKPPT